MLGMLIILIFLTSVFNCSDISAAELSEQYNPYLNGVRFGDPTPVLIIFHCPGYSSNELLEMTDTGQILYHTDELPAILERTYKALAFRGYPLAELDSLVYHLTPPLVPPLLRRGGESGSPLIKGGRGGSNDVIELFISTGKPLKSVGATSRSHLLTEGYILRQVREILDDLTDSGFPFASVSVMVENVEEHEDDLSTVVVFHVDKGHFSRLKSIEFTGARLTRSRLLRLESLLKRRDVFRRTQLERAVARLERLPYIDEVGTPQLYQTEPGLIRVVLPITERRVNVFSGVLSAAPNREELTGEVKVGFGNILGTGRRLQLEWLGLDPARRGILAGYREPWLFGYPWHGSFELEQWTEDTLSAATRLKFGLEWEPGDRLVLFGSVTDERIGDSNTKQIADRNVCATSNSITGSSGGSRAVWFEGGLSYDRLDRAWNPAHGYRARLSSASGLRRWKASDRSSSSLKREKAAAETILPLSERFVLFHGLAAEDIAGSGVVPENLIRIGGSGSIRGYAESVIWARGAVWGSMEFRWRPDREGYVGLFGDVGYVYREDSRVAAKTRYPVAYGITAGVLVKMGKLGLDLALAKGEPVQNARLHVRLEGWF